MSKRSINQYKDQNIVSPINSKWSSIQPIDIIRLTAQYLTLNQKLVLYQINHYWNIAINHPTAWISNPYNQWNSDNNTLNFNPNIHIPYLSISLQYISILNLYLYRTAPIIPIESRCIIYNSMKYLSVLTISTDYDNELESIDYQLIGNQFSHSLIRLKLYNYKSINQLNSKNLESLSKLIKLKILIIERYSIDLSGLHYINQLTELNNLGLIGCIGYNSLSPNSVNTELLFDNSIIPTMNRLLYLDLFNSTIEFNSFISLCNNNSLSNLLVFKLGNDNPYNAELLLSISKLINLTILDLSECIGLNNNILESIGRECKLLIKLNLFNCSINEPILSIGEFINLEQLNLSDHSGTAVTDIVLSIISKKLLKLKILYLGCNSNYTIVGLNQLTILVENYELIEIMIYNRTIHSIDKSAADNLIPLSLHSIINNNYFSQQEILMWNYIQIPTIV